MRLYCLCVLAALYVMCEANPAPLVGGNKPNAIQGEYIIVLMPTATNTDVAELVSFLDQSQGATVLHIVNRGRLKIVTSIASPDTIDAIRYFVYVQKIEVSMKVMPDARRSPASFGALNMLRFDQPPRFGVGNHQVGFPGLQLGRLKQKGKSKGKSESSESKDTNKSEEAKKSKKLNASKEKSESSESSGDTDLGLMIEA